MSDTFGEGPPQIAPGHFWRKMDGGQALRKDERKVDRREAPRSPAQPDAEALLRELADTIEAPYSPQNRARFNLAMAATRAFLAKAGT